MKNAFASTLRVLARKASNLLERNSNSILTSLVALKPRRESQGAALVAHLVEGVMLQEDDPLLRTHNHFAEAQSIASCLLKRGYTVDFIDYRNRWFIPKKRYDLYVSARTNFERIARRLNPDCIKVVHLDTSHWLFNNHAALDRLRDVCNRRGVALSSYKEIEYNRGIEEADCATLLGNEVTHQSYAFAGKTVFQIPNPGTTEFLWDENKDFDACRNRFLWLGSSGLVHKGLDLALEAFARMPDLHLTVCGPIERDRHFEDVFRKELYETPNIHTYGWIDVTGAEFAALANRTIGHIYPTCAEGAAGAVVNCMHFGLIPVTTPQAGVDVDPSFGLVFRELKVEAVQDAVRTIAGLPKERLADMARASHSVARRVYSREHYDGVFGTVIDRILAVGPGNLVPGFVPMDALNAPTPHLGGSDLSSLEHA